MILSKEEIGKYLGNDLKDLEGKIKTSVLSRLKDLDTDIINKFSISLMDYIFWEHHKGRSLNDLSRELGISRKIISKIFDIYSLPRLELDEARNRSINQRWQDPYLRERYVKFGKELWQNPDYRAKQEVVRRTIWQDTKFSENMAEISRTSMYLKNQDPNFRKKQVEGTKRKWRDSEYRIRHAKAMSNLWQDPYFRKRQAEATRRALHKRWQNDELRERFAKVIRYKWQDPAYREKHIEELKRRYQDPEYKEKIIERLRKARMNPEKIGKYHLPTIQGYRKDISFYAQSTWEANFARILIYCVNEFQAGKRFERREFYVRENFRLKVPKEFRHLFNSNKTEKSIDFVVKDPRGNIILYEITAHPLENPNGYAKLEMLVQQHPELKIKSIDGRFYNKLKKYFEEKINVAPYLSGWETLQDNLKTNPQKYGAPQK